MPVYTTGAILLGLACVSAATPLRYSHASVFARQEEAGSATCVNPDFSSFDEAMSTWNENGAGTRLDNHIASMGQDGWLNALASDSLPGTGDQASVGCGSRSQLCLTGDKANDCQQMVDDDRGAEYWIFNAVQKLQFAIERAHSNLQDSVIDSSLQVSSIASDFSITFNEDNKVRRYVAAAFGMASGMVGLGAGAAVNAVKTTATMIGGAFAASGVADTPIDPSKDMDGILKDIFAEGITRLDDILSTAVGGGGDYDSLPDQSGDYGSAVARFFADGKFLVQGNLVDDYFSAGFDTLNKKMVDVALQTFGYRILADRDIEDEATCAETGGAYWMDLDGGRCMRLATGDSFTGKWEAAPDTISKTMSDKYGIDVFGYFTNACALEGDGEVDLSNLPANGEIPLCYYNIKCQDAESCLDEEGDHDWYMCWLKDEFTDLTQTPTEPEEPAPEPTEEPTEPAFGSDQDLDSLGCYGSGHKWADLHGDGSNTDKQEVINDINGVCTGADGTELGLNDFWWACTEWDTDVDEPNHIWWEIQTEAVNDDVKTITWDVCNAAWNTEIDGCSAGSEQRSDGFWFRMDPQRGPCPYKKE